MVRVPGSSGDSQGFHRESTEEDVKIKMESGNESSTEEGSPPTALKAPGSSDRESAGRSSDDVKEEGSAMDLEDKPQTPLQVPSGTPAERDANRDPPDEVPHATSKKKKSKTSRKKLKAPESEAEDQEDRNTWTDEQLESAFFYKDLYKFLHEDPVMKILTPLVGSVVPVQRERTTPTRSQTGSSQYGSATSEAGSDSSIELQRMTLGPAGAAMLQSRKERSETKPTVIASSDRAQAPPERMQSFFNAAMEHFLKEQQAISTTRVVDQTEPPETEDVDMESVESNRRDHSHPSEYDPDDLSVDAAPRAVVVSAGTTGGGTLSATRIRVSAISELKEFSGKDNDEDRARSWFGKLKSAFVRDQAPDGEKCLVFGDLLTGPARNWYRQLSRTTRSNWKSLSKNFQTQYCGRGVSVARQYYHARKRSDESPLEYLHRLNVAGLRAQLSIKDGSIEVRREHVDHFIETLDDRDLASQLALLRIPDADTLEETLRSRQRAKARQGRTVYGSIKPKQKMPTGITPSANARAVRTVRTTANSSESEPETSGSEGEGDLRRVYFAATPDQPTRSRSDQEQRRPSRDSNDRRLDRPAGPLEGEVPRKPCSHCESSKHTDLGCWKRLTCEKCGKKGHPTDRCLFVCKACGEVHGAGECPMEEFYNLIRQWYNPTKHGGMLPQASEKMLN
uniref:Retrotransposon gag domain-containing protein n=1 Tax=Phytophthora ramorum TaxID=164328 RepID=H3H6F8_PHYRM